MLLVDRADQMARDTNFRIIPFWPVRGKKRRVFGSGVFQRAQKFVDGIPVGIGREKLDDVKTGAPYGVECISVKIPEIDEQRMRMMHTTMQTLGRVAIIGGAVLVALVNIVMFSDIGNLAESEQARVYARIYSIALVIPLISVSGVVLGEILKYRRRAHLLRSLGCGLQVDLDGVG